MFNKLHESYTMFNKLHESYTMFNKLHDLHSLTLCSTNYMTCTVLHYVQQTTWVLHYVQQTTSLAQSYTTFNKLHHLHSHKTTRLFVCWSLTSLCHSNGHIETMPAREINPFTALTRIHKTTRKIQTKYWTFSAAMIFSCNIKYSRLSWVHPPFLSHSKI